MSLPSSSCFGWPAVVPAASQPSNPNPIPRQKTTPFHPPSYGFMPQRIAFWIYWQAVVLIAKGVAIHPKPDGPSFKGRVAEEAAGKLAGVGGKAGGCPFSWTDAPTWPWYL